jgi:pimeloyl-ACP methyl ester carboxylesterase
MDLHVESYGAGPALVLVHGTGGSSLSWWQQVPRFASRFRVVVYDQRGFGRSRCAPEERHPRHLAGDLGRVLDAVGERRAAVVCQSLGGWAGLPFALAHPERVAALVLSGTPGGLLLPGILRDLSGVPARAAARPGVAGMALGASFAAREPADVFLYERIAALNPSDTVAVYARGLLEMRVEPAAAAGMRVPTLLVAGSEDAFFSVAGLREVAGAIPGARLEVIEGAGHSPYWEEPDAFHARVAAFLEEVGPWDSSS